MITDSDAIDLADLFVRQYGGTVEDAKEIMDEWRSIFNRRGLSGKTVREGMIRVLEEGPPLRKDTRLSAILKACGSTPKVLREFVYCDRCKGIGGYDVPHDKDYSHSGIWNGRYMMWVRCLCSNGDKFGPCTTLDFYESRFPHWREDYPAKQIERQMMHTQTLIDEETDSVKKEALEYQLLCHRSRYDKLFPSTAPAAAPIQPPVLSIGEIDNNLLVTETPPLQGDSDVEASRGSEDQDGDHQQDEGTE